MQATLRCPYCGKDARHALTPLYRDEVNSWNYMQHQLKHLAVALRGVIDNPRDATMLTNATLDYRQYGEEWARRWDMEQAARQPEGGTADGEALETHAQGTQAPSHNEGGPC